MPRPLPAAEPLADRERDAVVGDVEQVLCDLISDLEPEADLAEPEPGGRGRPRILPALALWAGLLVCVLEGWSSQRARWRLLTLRRLWHYPRFSLSDQAVSKRLAEAGTAPLERLFAQLSQLLAVRLTPSADRTLAPFAAEVVALDETTLDPVARSLPSLRDVPSGAATLLPGKLAGVFDLRRQQWRQLLAIPDPHQNEKVAARTLLEGLARGALILADLGYFGFKWFDDLTDAGFHWVSRLQAKTSYRVIPTPYHRGDTFDGVVWLGASNADKAKHAGRLVQFRVGPHLHRSITNVLAPAVLPAKELARLYARRWDIELAIKLVKRHLGLHLLWSAKPGVILQQVWAVLVIAQVLQALRVEIAGRAGVDIFEVSLPLLVEDLPHLAAMGDEPVAVCVAEGRRVGFIRPSSRTVIQAPEIPPEDHVPRPPGLVLRRKPRYAERKCGPRAA